MVKEEIFKDISNAVVSCKKDSVKSTVEKAFHEGIPPEVIIEKGIIRGMDEVGVLFESGKLFLPHLVLASDAMEAGISVLEKELQEVENEKLGIIVIGTVEGDVHDIGKIIVSSMLRISGFEVYDLGRDVPLQDFIDKVKETHADMLCISALTTISLSRQKELIEMLMEQDLRDSVKVMIGGAAASMEWAEKIGADCYAKNAVEAVAKIKSLFLQK
ncbi:corrinoid protein [Methanolobus zinderi]|uniref:Corrinoid protein n=1 Tax=Methanolobus zinderi TaxID=536044 RepID=A0A7D5I3G9_9EURY|nr:corrinoid protein [Methanolobus zinderi]QLC48941.1 corrinoid protein [Methanolobus zinderi]